MSEPSEKARKLVDDLRDQLAEHRDPKDPNNYNRCEEVECRRCEIIRDGIEAITTLERDHRAMERLRGCRGYLRYQYEINEGWNYKPEGTGSAIAFGDPADAILAATDPADAILGGKDG